MPDSRSEVTLVRCKLTNSIVIPSFKQDLSRIIETNIFGLDCIQNWRARWSRSWSERQNELEIEQVMQICYDQIRCCFKPRSDSITISYYEPESIVTIQLWLAQFRLDQIWNLHLVNLFEWPWSMSGAIFQYSVSIIIRVLQGRTGTRHSCTIPCLFHNNLSFKIIMEQTRKNCSCVVYLF